MPCQYPDGTLHLTPEESLRERLVSLILPHVSDSDLVMPMADKLVRYILTGEVPLVPPEQGAQAQA
ncbi:MAG: hypothetical protein KGL39_06675 [Patescibacteria group bacterium]|nr:hypothetical protein [Patescibacteria group bacterium]